MMGWRTKLTVKSHDKMEPINIKIKRGIYQGDALSALWFCIAINPLSNTLNNKKCGYKVPNSNQQVSHLIYMDDLKLFSETNADLKKLLRITEEFSNDIKMNFGLDKCRTNSIVKGKWHQNEDFRLLQRSGGGVITAMDKNESYKYLGFLQSQGIDEKEVNTTVGKNERSA